MGRYLGTLQLVQMALNFSNGQAARIERDDLVIETRPAGWVFGDDLRFKTAVAIMRNLDRQFAEVALERLLAVAVASIAGGIHNGIMPGMPQGLVIPASKARSTKTLVNCLSRPFSPIRSSGF